MWGLHLVAQATPALPGADLDENGEPIMAATTLPLMTVRGRVRGVDPAAISNGDRRGEVFGTRLTILTEPMGGFAEVLAFVNEHDPQQLAGLVGKDVEVRVSVGVSVSGRGVGFLQTTLVAVLAVEGKPVEVPKAA